MKISPYILIFKANLAKEVTYRFNFLFNYVLQITRLLIALAMWSQIFNDQHIINNYTWNTIVCYYGFSAIFFILCSPTNMFELQPLIRKGTLSSLLIKPINIQANIFAKFAAVKVPAILILTSLIFIIFQMFGIKLNANLNLQIIILIASSFSLAFYFGLFVSVLAFWLVEMWPLRRVFQCSMALLGGGIAPLDLLPEYVRKISSYTPFPYLGYYNVKAVQGNLSENELYNHIAICLLWTLISAILFKILWKKGLKKYEAVNL